jgi:Xaa-Pro aminopeptidase
MFSKEKYNARRKQLIEQIQSGLILIFGNADSPINYRGNVYPFRQDSNFLYFFGIDVPGMVGLIDADSGEDFLFGTESTIDDEIWTGPVETLEEMGQKCGVQKTFSIFRLESYINKAIQLNRAIHYLPPYRGDRVLQLSDLLSISPAEVEEQYSKEMVSAIIQLRLIKDRDEVQEIEQTLDNVTSKMMLKALQICNSGVKESEIVAAIESISLSQGCYQAYQPICSVNGQYLHNESYKNILQEGQLLLLDAGSESPMHYATDITRTFPVSNALNTQQADIYSLVLDMQKTAFSLMKPGIKYLDVHLQICKVLAQGLVELGLMHGNIEEIVSEGAHAIFFPHGLGHLVGLDVHDMEDLGENNVGYNDQVKRSNKFGTQYLRYAKELMQGIIITVEPGIYFIPPLIEEWRKKKKFEQFINYQKLESYMNFGGIRIEDNAIISDDGCRILGKPIPKSIAEIESLKNLYK